MNDQQLGTIVIRGSEAGLLSVIFLTKRGPLFVILDRLDHAFNDKESIDLGTDQRQRDRLREN